MLIMLIIFFFILVFCIIVFSKTKEIARINEEWMRSAGKLKLAFKKAGGILDTPRISGDIDGIPVSIHVNMERKGDHLAPFTVYSLSLPEGSGIESVLDRASARVESVRTGHPVIDKLFSAGGFDRGKLRTMMSDAKEAIIEKFSKSFPMLSVSDNRIVCKFEGVDSDADMILSRVNQLVRLAKLLSWKGGETGSFGGIHINIEEEETPSSFEAQPQSLAPNPILSSISGKHLERSARKPEPANEAKAIDKQPAIPAASQIFFGESRHATDPKLAVDSKLVADSKFATESKLATQAKSVVESKSVLESRQATSSKPLASNATPVAAAGLVASDCSSDPESLAKGLFSAPFPGQAEKTLFESVKGSKVTWTGVLKTAQEYGMDFTFSGGSGTKATFEVCDVLGSSSIKMKVKAVVQLPKDASQKLKGMSGKTFTFTGTLLKFEPFSKEIYISGGTVSES